MDYDLLHPHKCDRFSALASEKKPSIVMVFSSFNFHCYVKTICRKLSDLIKLVQISRKKYKAMGNQREWAWSSSSYRALFFNYKVRATFERKHDVIMIMQSTIMFIDHLPL